MSNQVSRTSKPQLSLLEKLDLIPAVLSVCLTIVGALAKAPFRGKNSPPTLYGYVMYSAVRKWLSRASTRQLQSVAPSTTEFYAEFAKTKEFAPQSFTLADGTQGHWIGSPDADKVVLYCHGGGFAAEANPFHFEICWEYHQLLKEAGKDVSFVMLAYSLAPGSQYPYQIGQAVAALGYLVNVAGKKPSNIMLQGDSAGAHMALGILSHLSHPHPQLPPLRLTENLRGAALFSPWIVLDTSAPSMARNAQKDIIPLDSMDVWSKAYVGDAPPDKFNLPLSAPSEWWSDLKVDDVIIVGGEDEVLVDTIREFSEKFTAGHPKTTTVIAPNEAHVAPVLDRLAGNKGPWQQDEAMRSWLLEYF
ncbi:MAG: hypothetical protein M4579_004638 [Chaenotheca gracillima]|nr:MAG: hypothetical protein M4579_004638 [Chaenotheca gracillima]